MITAHQYTQIVILIVQPFFLWASSQAEAFHYSARVLGNDLGSYSVDEPIPQG